MKIVTFFFFFLALFLYFAYVSCITKQDYQKLLISPKEDTGDTELSPDCWERVGADFNKCIEAANDLGSGILSIISTNNTDLKIRSYCYVVWYCMDYIINLVLNHCDFSDLQYTEDLFRNDTISIEKTTCKDYPRYYNQCPKSSSSKILFNWLLMICIISLVIFK
jgi:hypothetical protein